MQVIIFLVNKNKRFIYKKIKKVKTKKEVTKMDYKKLSQLFYALGDETRLKLVHVLYKEETYCVKELLQMVNISQSTLSYHLAILYENNIVSFKKEGKQVFYYCNKHFIDKLMNIFK